MSSDTDKFKAFVEKVARIILADEIISNYGVLGPTGRTGIQGPTGRINDTTTLLELQSEAIQLLEKEIDSQ